MANIIPLGHIVASSTTPTPIVAPRGAVNKIVIQASVDNGATETLYVGRGPLFTAPAAAGKCGELAAGEAFVAGDESGGDVENPNDFYVLSKTGAGVFTGFLYER